MFKRHAIQKQETVFSYSSSGCGNYAEFNYTRHYLDYHPKVLSLHKKKKNTCDDRKTERFYCLELSLWFGVRYHLHIRCQHLAPVLHTPVISRIIWTTGIANAVSMEEIDTKHLKQNKKEKIVLEVVEETTMSVSFGESRYNLQCDGSQTKVKCLFVTKNAEKTQSCLFNPRKHTLPKVSQT